jgi:hypothetical protein
MLGQNELFAFRYRHIFDISSIVIIANGTGYRAFYRERDIADGSNAASDLIRRHMMRIAFIAKQLYQPIDAKKRPMEDDSRSIGLRVGANAS